jgi:PEP-CTERM motif
MAIGAGGFVAPASATNITATFNFNNMGSGGTSSQNQSSNTISTYMSSVLQGLGFGPNKVTVTGGIGQQGASSYAGEGFTVGPKIGSTDYSLTLANTDGAATPDKDTTKWDGYNNSNKPPVLSNANTDGFIKNCTSVDPGLSANKATGCGGNSPDIFMDFHGLKIVSIKFDFQIFPDGTCPSLNPTPTKENPHPAATCGTNNANLPDFELWWGDNGTRGINDLNTTAIKQWWGTAPGTHGTDGGGLAGNTYTNSPNHTSSTETAPQLLGVSGLITIANYTNKPVTTLDFMDWPETIGLDNLVIYFAPEPGTLALFGFGLLGLLGLAWRKRTRLAS